MATPARKVNWFAIWISVAVVVVLVVVGALVVVMNNQSTSAGPAPTGTNINADTGAISVGTGAKTMDTYVDFMCPICNQFETTFGNTITGLVSDSTITLNVHPIAILDASSQGTAFSSRAASAMYCVAEVAPDKAMAFMQSMYKNQPAENSSGLTDEQIVAIAAGAGVTGADSCITSNKYMKYVQSMTKKTPIQPGQSGIATPTVAINGTTISNSKLPSDPTKLIGLFS
ncbi:MAG: DsbA family protein [Actinobacteria bacterium]|nr:DsbA family protein [Actinomycetota bacterium]